MAQKPANKIGEKKGTAGRGRPKGSPNKTTAVLKDAILLAAESVGEDGAGIRPSDAEGWREAEAGW